MLTVQKKRMALEMAALAAGMSKTIITPVAKKAQTPVEPFRLSAASVLLIVPANSAETTDAAEAAVYVPMEKHATPSSNVKAALVCLIVMVRNAVPTDAAENAAKTAASDSGVMLLASATNASLNVTVSPAVLIAAVAPVERVTMALAATLMANASKVHA